MQLTPEIKAQLAEQKKQCLFCKLISQEIPGKIVFEDDKTLAVMDIYPAVKGHTLFMLKEHYPLPMYAPEEELLYKFSLLPGLCKALKDGLVKTSFNLFVALGAAAGQQSYHFMLHLLPRESEDKFFNFLFKKSREKLSAPEINSLAQKISALLQGQLQDNPAAPESSQSSENIPSFLNEVYNNSQILYQDNKILCLIPNDNIAKGHLVIYSKLEEKYLEKLSPGDAAHMFKAALQVSSAIFENFKAQGTNILLKSGETDDNPRGRLAVHIFPRWQNDNLQELLWPPKQPSYDLDSLAGKIKDQTWKVKYSPVRKADSAEKKKEENIVIKVSDEKKPEAAGLNPLDEIKKAIELIRK